jgi:hypothetical protein
VVAPGEQFDPSSYASICEELDLIKEKTSSLPPLYKTVMLISFLKDHSLQNDWIAGNPELTERIVSGALFTGSIESLFEASKTNCVFTISLEAYLSAMFER